MNCQQLPTRKLGDPNVAEIILGQSPPSSTYNDTEKGLPFFQGKADFGLLYPKTRMWCSDGQKFAQAGDILLSVRAPVGDVNIATQKCVIGRGVAAIRASAEVNSWYLYFALLHSKPILERRATGSTFASINKTTLHNLEIPFLSYAEQAAIGASLQQVIEKTGQEILAGKATGELEHATMHHLFTRGLRGETQKKTAIGMMPESWAVVRLGSLGKIGNGSTPKRTISAYWNDGKFPWLTSAKVYDRNIKKAEQFVTETALKKCHLPKVKPGAVLMAITGQGKTLGHCAVLNIEATINQHIAYIQINSERANSGFIRGYLETQYDYLRQVASGNGSTKGALTCAFLKELSIPFPPTLDEQQKIAAILDTLDRKISLHRQKRAVLQDLLQSLLHQLMTGKIRVNDLDLSALPAAPATEPPA